MVVTVNVVAPHEDDFRWCLYAVHLRAGADVLSEECNLTATEMILTQAITCGICDKANTRRRSGTGAR